MEKQLICISRQYGSGGREIGEAVAKKLGLPCYDKCLIHAGRTEIGAVRRRIVAEYDERGEDLGIRRLRQSLRRQRRTGRNVLF